MSAVIRVPNKTHEVLQAMAARRKVPVSRIVEEAVAQLEADEFWAMAHQEDLAMRADPGASAAFDAEVAAWDATLLDGLEDSPWEE